MDPASLDPRLREAGEDSIVVHDDNNNHHHHHQHHRQHHRHRNTHERDAAIVATDDRDDHDDDDDDDDEDNDDNDNDDYDDYDSGDDSPRQHQPQQQQRPQQRQRPLQPLTTVTATTTTTTTTAAVAAAPIFPPPPPPPPPVTPSASASISIAPAPTLTPTGEGTPQDPNDPKRPRACEACRGLKVKCEPDLLNPDGPCKRCAKAGRGCVVTQPTRKRQKKTDSRVAELEKKIDALTASLQASRGSGGQGPPPPPTPTPPPQRTSAAEDAKTKIAREWGPPVFPFIDGFKQDKAPMAGQKRKFAETPDGQEDLNARRVSSAGRQQSQFPSQPQFQPQFQPQPPSDVVDRGIITADEASVLFQRYTDRMATHLPAVVFPPGTTAADIRRTQPILYLAIMSVASSETPNLQRLLVKELMQIFADKLIIQGEKSLELVQSIMVSVVWYFPPEHFEQLKFYQMIHLAAVMAIDIGLGKRKNSPKSRLIPYTWRDHPFRKQPLPDPSTIESRRTWLAVYFLAANVSMALHRPNLIRWQSFMTECMDILESSPEAAPSDRYLCHLVWTHRLAEEVGIQFSMDDPSIFVNVTDQKVQYALRGFERDLAKYSDNIPKEDRQPSLLLSFSVLNLYMHEIALQTNEEYSTSNTEALRDPIPGLGDTLTAAHIGALSSCLTAIDGIFETFLSLDVPTIRCVPIFNFVRVAYAVVVLIKIYFSASSPNSELGKVINKDNMKVAEYLDRLLEKFRETAAQDKSRPAGKFLVVLAMVRGWFQQQQGGQGHVRSQSQKADSDLKSSQTPQPNPAATPSTSAETVSHSSTIPDQQPPYHQSQNSKQSEYNPGNTPLQLLSEIATGNGPSRNQSTSSQPVASMNTPGQGHSSWGTAAVHLPYIYDPNTGMPTSAPTSAPGGMAAVAMGGQPHIPWTNGPFGGDMNYLSMGDGFEQAMGLTLTGFGGDSPGDNVSYENSLRMMGDANLMGVMDDFSANGGNVFNF
ncbi:hypothetical protein F4860DRAFT_495207 [Xylaria cubensis]|nr:hypothetical protein F4860DRAFT_495207 [Xylaria cubensis]